MKLLKFYLIICLFLFQSCTYSVLDLFIDKNVPPSNLRTIFRYLLLNPPVSDTFDIASSFNYNQNPNGVWSYGYKTSATGSFTLYTRKVDDRGQKFWYLNSSYTPSFFRNESSSTRYQVEPNEVALHPGYSGEISVLRWTAPKSGKITINGAFKSGDTGNVDVYVLQNSTTLFSKTNTSSSESFSLTTTVSSGDTVDFQVGTAGDYTSDSTPTNGTITYTNDSTTGTGTNCTIATGAQLPYKTGQTISYATGDDGHYKIGLARTFTDNGDGTISQGSGCPIWQKCSRGQTNDSSCSGSATSTDWRDAGTYCSTLRLGGKTWRLPTINELGNLVDYSRSTPSVNSTFFPATDFRYYWSSSTYAPSTNSAWTVYFDFGVVGAYDKLNNTYVRCVSGTNNTPTTTFTDNSNGTVTDQATGLVWQKCSAGLSGTTCTTGSAGTYSWTNALNYCNSMSLASRSWRLPSANELRTIIDLTRTSSPTINTTAFPATFASGYWSSSSFVLGGTGAWYVVFSNGVVAYDGKTSNSYVRCVSGP